MELRLGFLASHGGSNVQAILDAIQAGRLSAEPRLVISNNSQAQVLVRAAEAGVPTSHISNKTHPDAETLDRAVLAALQDAGVNLVILAGYMKKLGAPVLAAYRGRVLNIHPALLPRHGGQGMFGMHVHRAVIAAHEAESGATVHIVDEEYDRGPILAQACVPVLPLDTPDSLAARVLAHEHRLYPDTLGRIALGEIRLDA